MSSTLSSDSTLSGAKLDSSLVTVGEVGTFLIEQRSSTPLGPRIVKVGDEFARLTGYDAASLVGSPLGLVYDRADLASLISKLPTIALGSSHCFMYRVLLRNGGARRLCRWTIRPTSRPGEPKGLFSMTVQSVIPKGAAEAATKAKKHHAPPAKPKETLATAKVPAAKTIAPTPQVKAPVAKPAPVESKPAPEVAKGDYEQCRSESISLAAAGVAHDFKNALQTIKMNLELAALATHPEERSSVHLSEAMLALGDAETLAHQMLAFTRGGMPQKKVFRLDPLMQRVSRLCSAGSGIRCRLHVAERLRCVEGDSNQIYQVLHNLVINARQAMPNGGTIDIIAANAELPETNDFAMPGGRYAVISVKDRGCGIVPENLPRIFDENFTTKRDGSGFGLASSRAIILAHGGAIRVASKVGVGTEFLVFLPSTDAGGSIEAPARPEASSIATARRPVAGIERILVVEDQPGVARSTMGILRQLGYESLLARSGEEAISIYRERLHSLEPIDVVLLDMTLPGGLSGLEVARELRRFDPSTCLIATSGYFEEGSEIPGEGIFSAALPKPYGVESLSEVLEKVASC